MRFRIEIDRTSEEEVLARVHGKSEFTSELENLVLHYTGRDSIPAYTEGERLILEFSDIECISLIGGKTYAVSCSGKKYLLRYRLYELEKLLPDNFIRINKSAVANRNHLKKFTASFNGAVDAVFRCGYTENVSRRCFADIKRRFNIK